MMILVEVCVAFKLMTTYVGMLISSVNEDPWGFPCMGIQGWRIFSHGNKDEGESVKYLGIIWVKYSNF
jgi:hypothetical protein